MATKTNKTMSDDHKAALAEGRAQGRAVRSYLKALEDNRPKRGRKRTESGITKRLEAIETLLESADPLKRVQLIQERMDLRQELEGASQNVDLSALEKDFVANAAAYSQRKKISWAAWRELGVPASVLRDAGVPRG
jgi:uncharacterized protein YicC (UPF0701 family)